MRNKIIRSAPLLILLSICIYIYPQQKNWAVFFTKPDQKKTDAITPQKAVLQLIKNAQKSIYCAVFDFDDPIIADELIAAKNRNIDIKIVTEKDNIYNEPLKKLVLSGIAVVADNKAGLMHNKFILIDDEYVWTGSYNLTLNGENKNNNNGILIKSKKLYDIYYSEFSEMFDYRVFSNKKDTDVGLLKNKHYVKEDDIAINVFFSPDDDIEKNIIKKVKSAEKSIYFMAFSFTSDGIGEEMIKAHKRGLDVKGVFESRGSGTEYSEYYKMKIEGIDVRKDKNPAYLHHKVIIIDGEWVITGSYNFSKNAQNKNDENCIFIRNFQIASLYTNEFESLYK